MRLELKQFDLRRIRDNRIVLIIGPRGTGKSTLLFDILYNLCDRFDFGVAMSPTLESLIRFRQCFPGGFVFEDGYKIEQLRKMVHILRMLAAEGKPKRGLLVLDDCMADKKIFTGTEIRDLFYNGRHYNFTFVNCMQYMMDMTTDLRSQVDYLFVLNENILANKQRLHKYFFGQFTHFEDFNKVLETCTNNYECLVLDNTVKSNDPRDKLGFYKAREYTPKFRICRPVFWILDHFYRKEKQKQERLRPIWATAREKIARAAEPVADPYNPRVQYVVKKKTNFAIQPPPPRRRPPSILASCD